MRTQFIVQESNKRKREEFYNYIKETYNLSNWHPYDKEKFINNKFPFVIDFKDNSFWICDSITCCACAAQAGIIQSIDEFKKTIGNRYKKKNITK